MFKKFITIIVVSQLFFNTAFAQNSASTEQDLLAVIKQLQAQIQSLQQQVADLHAEVQSVKLELKFSRALAQGATGNDVKQLQEFLKNFTGAYPDGSVTGYFGPQTAAAVKRFQEQNGIASVGIVGPKTQDKLNVLAAAIPAAPAVTPVQSGGQTTTAPATSFITPVLGIPADPTIQAAPVTPVGPITPATPCKTPSGVQIQSTSIKVYSPNGGEQWQTGGTYVIKYSAKDIGNKALLIYLEKGYDAPTTKTGANSSLLIGVTTNLESYTYKVPQNIQSFPGVGSNYKITIMVEGSYSSCGVISYDGDSSDATFSIVAGQYNVPAVTPNISITPVTPVSGGGYGQEDIETQIRNLQEKLINTTDPALRDSLIAQITALKAQMQVLQDKKAATLKQILALQYQLYYTTDTAARDSLIAQITALGGQAQVPTTQTTQDQITALLGEISAYQNKLNNTTDPAARDSLMAQITALKARAQILESNPATPVAQPVTSVPSGVESATASISGTFVSAPTTPAVPGAQDKINILFAQVASLQNQLNSTIDTAKRDSLVAQIIALKAEVQALQTNSAAISTTPGTTTGGGGYGQPTQDNRTATQMPEISAKQAPQATQDKIAIIYGQINALLEQLNGVTDTATKDSLWAKINALKAQAQSLLDN